MSTTRGLIIFGVIALLWNVMGIAAFVMQYTADLNALAKTDAYQAKLFAGMPKWAWVAYAVAVFGGLAATIALLLRRRSAVPLYAISLIAVVAQFSHTFFGTDLLAVRGWATAIFPAVIFLLGLLQFLYARSAAAKGLLR